VRLYEALAGEKKQKISHLTPAQITKAGLSGKDAVAAEALDTMATWLGRFAGDIALHYGATGGVFLAGGLPSNIVPVLQTGRFREAFDGAGDRHAYLAAIPVKVLKTGADAGIRGAAIALANSLPTRAVPLRRLRA
jgi:glucokinase